METTVSIRLPSDLAKRYRQASEAERLLIEGLVASALEPDKEKARKRMIAISDRVGKKARERGLTEEILNEILNEK